MGEKLFTYYSIVSISYINSPKVFIKEGLWDFLIPGLRVDLDTYKEIVFINQIVNNLVRLIEAISANILEKFHLRIWFKLSQLTNMSLEEYMDLDIYWKSSMRILLEEYSKEQKEQNQRVKQEMADMKGQATHQSLFNTIPRPQIGDIT